MKRPRPADPGSALSRLTRSLSARALLGIAAFLGLTGAAATRGDEPVSYNRDVRPILAENCFSCHGPDSAARKADLRLDRLEDAARALASGSAAIVPGDPDSSELVFRIEADDPTIVMPPPELHKTLSDAQRDVLNRWIAGGAEYQPHWSFIPPQRPEQPAVQNAGWVRNPIDGFVLSGIEAAGLGPATEADRRTLARRAALDVTGLPPAPAEVEAFVADTEPNAYERYVDRLLQSQRWGEHRARAWLDAARYADTHGFHFDNYREMWSYRDWVINAFNRNMPFDTFTVEQLAGDLLPDATLDQRIASGFNRCNMTTNEGGTIPEEYLVLYARDRTETVAQVWMGLTAGCAVCHDHKFDPLSQNEFYALSAFFNNTTQNAMDGNIKDTPPTIFVPADEDRPRWDALTGELGAARSALEARQTAARPEFEQWLAAATGDALQARIPATDQRLQARLAPRTSEEPVGAGPLLESSDAGRFEKDQAFSAAVWVRPSRDAIDGALVARMDDGHGFRGWDILIDKGRIVAHLVSAWPEDAIRVVGEGTLRVSEWNHVVLTYDGSGKAGGVKLYRDGLALKLEVSHDRLSGSIVSDVPLKAAQRHASARLSDASLSDLRLYGRALDAAEAAELAGASRALELVRQPAEQRRASEVDATFAWWLAAVDDNTRGLRERLATLAQEETALRARGTIAHVAQERPETAMAHVLFRGEYDQRRDAVEPKVPGVLPPFPADQPRNRLGLARWLLQPEHPLTARVTVNRFWQEVFGAGLVRTTGDFGVSGELPSHPELLDWLAVEFRETGWDVKRLFRLILTSATYRQSAQATPEKLEKDPANRLLARGPRFRMEAEMVRDYALAASGLLVEEIGGPSVKPYQPAGVWEAVAMPESNTKKYEPDGGNRIYRRTLYTFWKRAAPPALLDLFNAPSRETCTVRRERTNTPLQALATLNDPTFVEAARYLAERALAGTDATTVGRLDFMASHVLARPLRPEESSVLEDTLVRIHAYYVEHPDDARALIQTGQSRPAADMDIPALAAWTLVGNQLFNLDEALNK